MLLVVVAPVVTIGGIIWSISSLAVDASTGPVAMEGATAQVEVPADAMLIVYVPKADEATAECTAEGADPGAVTTVPSSTDTTFGDGSEYVQVLGVAAVQDTTVTVTCTGTDAPAHLGPYSVFSMAGPLLIGLVIGVLAGLIGRCSPCTWHREAGAIASFLSPAGERRLQPAVVPGVGEASLT